MIRFVHAVAGRSITPILERGFASSIGGKRVTEADERAKLKLCVDAAAIWGEA